MSFKKGVNYGFQIVPGDPRGRTETHGPIILKHGHQPVLMHSAQLYFISQVLSLQISLIFSISGNAFGLYFNFVYPNHLY